MGFPEYFSPRQEKGFFAAQGALFLIDPARLVDEAGTNIVGKDLLPRIHGKPLGERLYAAGAMVPALGLEVGFYTVDVRSTATEGEGLALTHIVFSTGFVLGTETGELMLANGDRLTPWTPGSLPASRTPMALENYERVVRVSPGWYGVTVVVGLLEAGEDADDSQVISRDEDYDFNQDTWDEDAQMHRPRRRGRPKRVAQEEQWVCSFLLDPREDKPEFGADLAKGLNLFGG